MKIISTGIISKHYNKNWLSMSILELDFKISGYIKNFKSNFRF